MVSFMRLWENMTHEKDAEHIDTGAMKAIRTGLNIRDNFWDDFLVVLNNAEALSELLGVRPEQIAGWASRIKHNLERVKRADVAGEGEEKPKAKVLDTGDDLSTTGGISMNPIGAR
jgi:hypothetical protein